MSTACPSVQPFMAAISGKKQHLSAARELNEAQRSLTVQSHTVRSSEVESPLSQPVKRRCSDDLPLFAGGSEGSEAEGKELGTAGCIAVNQSAEADLVSDPGAGETFGEDSDHDSEHGRASVEELSTLELLKMNVAGSSGLKPRLVGLVGLHDRYAIDTKCNAFVSICLLPASPLSEADTSRQGWNSASGSRRAGMSLSLQPIRPSAAGR